MIFVLTVRVDPCEANDSGRLHLLRRDRLVVVSVVVDDRLGADDKASTARLRNGDKKRGFTFNVVLLPWDLEEMKDDKLNILKIELKIGSSRKSISINFQEII